MQLKINWEHRRAKHAIERMTLRGVSVHEVEEAILKGKRVIQRRTGLAESFHRFFSVVYDEVHLRSRGVRKVYPVTVKLL
ncbi:MAG: DUF4258 domain-containing protein [Halobacteria archaeon]